MLSVVSNNILNIPLFHATSTLFLNSILEHGLGGKNIVNELNVLDNLQEIYNTAERLLPDDNEWQSSKFVPRKIIDTDPHVAGGAGSKFDLGVSFGNGAGPKGNGTLQAASFTLLADQPLSIEDLAPMSSTSSGIAIQLAVHVQDTSFVEGVTSETVGGLMGEGDPGEEPSSAEPSSPESEPL